MIVAIDEYPKYWSRGANALLYRVRRPGLRPYFWDGVNWLPSGEYSSEAALVCGESAPAGGYLFVTRIVGIPDVCSPGCSTEKGLA